MDDILPNGWLRANIFPVYKGKGDWIAMWREYEDIVFFWKCLHGMCDINVYNFAELYIFCYTYFLNAAQMTPGFNDTTTYRLFST